VAAGGGGLTSMMGLLHQFMEVQTWRQSDVDRAKQVYMSNCKSLPKSLERKTGDLIMGAMFGPERQALPILPYSLTTYYKNNCILKYKRKIILY